MTESILAIPVSTVGGCGEMETQVVREECGREEERVRARSSGIERDRAGSSGIVQKRCLRAAEQDDAEAVVQHALPQHPRSLVENGEARVVDQEVKHMRHVERHASDARGDAYLRLREQRPATRTEHAM